MDTNKERKPRKTAEETNDVKIMIRIPKLAAAALNHEGKGFDLDARGMLENTVIASLRGADLPLNLARAVDQMRRTKGAEWMREAPLFDMAALSDEQRREASQMPAR
jgi:hypothetical protein